MVLGFENAFACVAFCVLLVALLHFRKKISQKKSNCSTDIILQNITLLINIFSNSPIVKLVLRNVLINIHRCIKFSCKLYKNVKVVRLINVNKDFRRLITVTKEDTDNLTKKNN